MDTHKITSARDQATDGAEYIRRELQKRMLRGERIQITRIDNPVEAPVLARINFGRWIADCECGGAEFIDPAAPVFFCWSCLNAAHQGACRTVTVPQNFAEIEQTLLERPVDAGGRPLVGVDVGGVTLKLGRDWNPHETLNDLHAQQDDAINAFKKRDNNGI